LQTNPCIRHNFSTQVFRKRAAQLHYVGPELRYIFWPPLEARGCETKRWSHWTCSSLGTIFQPMRVNSVPDLKCFCNNKNLLRAQSMVWHFVRHPVYASGYFDRRISYLSTTCHKHYALYLAIPWNYIRVEWTFYTVYNHSDTCHCSH
jgi:hypothetical protein